MKTLILMTALLMSFSSFAGQAASTDPKDYLEQHKPEDMTDTVCDLTGKPLTGSVGRSVGSEEGSVAH